LIVPTVLYYAYCTLTRTPPSEHLTFVLDTYSQVCPLAPLDSVALYLPHSTFPQAFDLIHFDWITIDIHSSIHLLTRIDAHPYVSRLSACMHSVRCTISSR